MSLIAPLLLMLACSGTATDDTGPSGTDDTATTTGADADQDQDQDQDGFSADDCDDDDATVFPGAEELCDGVDQDCDDAVDEDFDLDWWPDADGDGYGDADEPPTVQCDAPGDSWVRNNRDCEDTDAGVFPGAEDTCDGRDQNCNDTIDEDADFVDWWPDGDGDGTGDGAEEPVLDCGLDATHATNDLDCDDADPGAPRFADPTAAPGASGKHGDPTPVIQELLDQGARCIQLAAGTYVENLTVKTDVWIDGVEGAQATRVEAPGSGSVVTVAATNATVTLSGLTLAGGVGQLSSTTGSDYTYNYSFGAGIYVTSGRVELIGSVLEGNHGLPMSYVQQSDGTYIYDMSYGGAIYATNTDLVMVDVDLFDNSAGYGAALYTYQGKVEATRVRVLGNAADFYTLYTGAETFDAANVLIAQNASAYADWLSVDQVLSLRFSTVADNEGDQQLAFYGQRLEVDGVIVSGGEGYGVYDEQYLGTYSYSLFNDLYGELGVSSGSGLGLLFEDPGFAGVSDDGDWSNDTYTLDPNSPCVDAGPPGEVDTDGSAADIGFWGGPEAP